MLFNSPKFFIFFPLVTAAYFFLPHRWRWALLLAASCYFYMAFIPAYILILFFTIAVDYVAGIAIENARGTRRKWFLLASILANVGVLAFFKYFNFFNANFAGLADFLGWNYPIENLAIILPIGLSFHTFQSLAYTIEVYRGRAPAERHFGIFALYVMFYPQLVAGPIERPQNLLPQFHRVQHFDYQRVADGLKLMAWGLFKKVVIADRLALLVNQVYGKPTEYQGLALILATVFFAYQIYCDFSGYSDIALGSAQVMGFRLMSNFERPYYAQSIAEFWRRWHISLSTWFRDYVYIPLGGNRVGIARWQFNLFVTFLISGLWHGANWTFVIWGALHGFYLLLGIWSAAPRAWLVRVLRLDRVPIVYALLQVSVTFTLVAFAWIFFRATNLADALYIVTHLFAAPFLPPDLFALGLDKLEFQIALLTIGILEIVQMWQRNPGWQTQFARQPAWVRWSAYYALMISIVLLGIFRQQEFIYFRF